MNSTKQRILDDLVGHFNARLRQLFGDSADRCRDADIDVQVAVIALTSAMLFEVHRVMIYSGFSKRQYLEICQLLWDQNASYHRQQLKKLDRSNDVT